MARKQTPAHLRREYEIVYLVDQEHEEPAVDGIIQRYREFVTDKGGKVVKLDNWGKRKLAYPINKQGRATYVLMQYLGHDEIVAEVERHMRLSDDIIRWQTIVLDSHVEPEGRAETTQVNKVIVEEEAPEPPRRDDNRGED